MLIFVLAGIKSPLVTLTGPLIGSLAMWMTEIYKRRGLQDQP